MFLIQHGSTRPPFVSTGRRVRWTDSGLTGAAGSGVVSESAPLTDDFARFVLGRDTVSANAGAFSVTASGSTSAEFGAGVAGGSDWAESQWSTLEHLRGQFADCSTAGIVVEQVA